MDKVFEVVLKIFDFSVLFINCVLFNKYQIHWFENQYFPSLVLFDRKIFVNEILIETIPQIINQ
jgi:hypothetical protein